MIEGHKIYCTGFADQAFAIDCNNDDAYRIADFLFLDFPGAATTQAVKHYDIISSGRSPVFSLWEDEERIYFGKSRYQLAYKLINEIIFQSIDSNRSHHALHAGCVCRGDRCLLLPGQSGNGKSTLTSWLIMNGFHYLTDELVLVDSQAAVLPLTRPISLKVGPSHPSWLLKGALDDIIADDSGSMIPHRLFNPNFVNQVRPRVTDLIFPQFAPDGQVELTEISPAKAILYLLQSHVNARNHHGHGVSELAAVVRGCRSYTLRFGSFDDLRRIFSNQLIFS